MNFDVPRLLHRNHAHKPFPSMISRDELVDISLWTLSTRLILL